MDSLIPSFDASWNGSRKSPGGLYLSQRCSISLKAKNGTTVLDARTRRSLEARWLWEKLFRGTS